MELLQPIKRRLQNFPIFFTGHFRSRRRVDVGFEFIFGRAIGFVEDAEVSGERRGGQGVGGVFVRHVVGGGDEFKFAAFARVRGIEGAFKKFHAFAQAFDHAETVMVHSGFHHLQQMIRIRMRRAGHKGRAGGDQLLHRVDRLIHRAPGVGLAFEAKRRRGGRLFLGQAIDPVVHDDVGHLDILAGRVIDVIAADGEGIAVTAEHEHMQVRAGQGNTAGKRE